MIKKNMHALLFNKFAFIFTLLSINLCVLQAQNQAKMTPAVYNEWRKITKVKLSEKAETVIYALEKELGDKTLCIYDKLKDTVKTFDRLNQADVDISGDFVVFTHGMNTDSLRMLKRKKTPKDKLPLDSLSIFNVRSGKRNIIERVSSFTMPSEFSGSLAYLLEPKKEVKDTTKTEKTKTPICKDKTLIIRALASGVEDTILNVKDFLWANSNGLLSYSQCTGDSIASYQVGIFDVQTRQAKIIGKSFNEVAQFSWDKKGEKLAFLGLLEKSTLTKKPFSLYLFQKSDSNAVEIIKETNSFSAPYWTVSNDKKPYFSESGKRLYFGMTPPALVKDTMRLEDEIVNVEIWHHDNPLLYTQLETTLDDDKKRSYLAVYDIGTKVTRQVEDQEIERSKLSLKGDGKYALLTKTKPYQKSITWLGEAKKDIYLYDMLQGKSTLIAESQSDYPSFSATEKYVYWYNKPDSLWKYYDIANQKTGFLGDKTLTAFYDEENDMPQLPDGVGVAGWLKDDSAILIYDKYDIWKISPVDPLSNIAITDGRNQKVTHRYISLDPEIEYIDTNTPLMLHVFDGIDKGESYMSLDMRTGKMTNLLSGDFALNMNLTKSKKSPNLIFTKQNFQIFPDLLLTDTTFHKVIKISDANPQQQNYAWGSNQLYKWNDYNGKEVHGMLFFPPSFEKNKQYPLIVNFYERSSDDFHKHRSPEAHRSTINYSYYTNQGYVIFNPDISYTTSQPGEDCYNAVNSGVDALLKQGYIDSTKMALQGHSWGGYQIAYLLIKTGRYKCAESGAPVVNMVSAYGGVRWGSGMSRIFQYERGQSRLGKSLWEDASIYHKNSPIYQMDKVTTPVLIMHNDEDGAVPWEQGIEYFMALRRLGKPTWLLNYNGEPHWPVKWQNRLDFNIRLEQFFNHFLMDAPMPLWMKEGNSPMEKGILDKY
jgi:dipeptidyl aminopeptidase/acylaminoacyl peptidase